MFIIIIFVYYMVDKLLQSTITIRTNDKPSCRTALITGSAVVLHVCKAHAKINYQ